MKYLLLACCIFCSRAIAQKGTEDSLKNELVKAKEDSSKALTLYELGKFYLGTDVEKSLTYSRQAIELADKIDFHRGKALALKIIGLVHYNQSKYKETLEYWAQSLQEFEATHDVNGVANMLSNLGAVYQMQGVDEKALDYFLKSLQKSEESKDKLRVLTALINVGSVYGNDKMATHEKALNYYWRALPLAEEINNKQAIGVATVNIGEIYMKRIGGKYGYALADSALYYLKRSLNALENSAELPNSLNDLGKVYTKLKNYDTAIYYHKLAYQIAEKDSGKKFMGQAMLGIAENQDSLNNPQAALNSLKQAEKYAEEADSKYDLKNIYGSLASVYAELGDYPSAFRYQVAFSNIKDEIYNIESDKKLGTIQFDYEIDKLTKDKQLQAVELKRQKLVKNALIIGIALVVIIMVIIYRDYRNKIRLNKILDSQKLQIETLLLNILPREVADELQNKGEATPRFYEQASVLFTDFKGFSALADKLSPQEVVTELNECFIAFDELVKKYNLEKIKTIGDSYMCAGGIPTPDDNHVMNIIKASLEMQEYIIARNQRRNLNGLPPWDIRIGINTGPLVAGVVGKTKYAYDIWGGTVNVASRMESNGEPGRVNISSATYELIKHKYTCTHRGKIFAKNIGEIDMYFIDNEI